MKYLDFRNINKTNFKEILLHGNNQQLPQIKHIMNFLEFWYSDSDKIKFKTSGSTSKDKSEICFTKLQLQASAERTLQYFNLSKGDKALLCLPLDYIAGKMMLVRAIVGKLKLYILEPSTNVWSEIDEKLDFAAMVPMQLQKMPFNADQFINALLIGGAPISQSIESKLQKMLINSYHSFGMTETLSHFAIRELKHDSQYELLEGVRVRTDSSGRLNVCVPWIAKCFMVTDDCVEMLSEKSFKWQGRFSSVINSGGIKHHPEAIENKLRVLLESRSFFISSLYCDVLGEKIVLYIEGKPIVGFEKKIVNYLDTKEIPKLIKYIDAFIYSSSGKILKKVTQDQALY
jgi:O-succinylbenzoic acid--CoA ligase